MGLSPHARGNLDGLVLGHVGQGPIPACAGEPFGNLQRGATTRAYPRMRGGTAAFDRQPHAAEGLSPHARGNPQVLAVSGAE